MKLNFRQGIVSYPQAGNVQQFMLYNAGVVDLSTTNGPTSITFAHKDTDYFLSEGTDVAGAWGPFAGNPVWLYWDLDRQTGLRSFGHTEVQPVSGPTEPLNIVEDLHWFDTLNATHFVRQGSAWVEVIRVFAAKLDGTTFSFLGDNARLPFAGSQVGLKNLTSFSGTVLFDEDASPVVKSSNGTFYTTETEFFNGSTRISGIRLESDVATAVLTQTVPAYRVVKYIADGRVELADYNDLESEAIAIATQDGIINDLISVVVQGVITNEQWDWQPANIGDPLWVELNGELTLNDPAISNPGTFPLPRTPVGRVIGQRQIIFMQGLGGVGPEGPAGDISNLPFASSIELGATFLDVDPDIATLPIAVGVNSPLLAGAPFAPLTHLTDPAAHPGDDITFSPAGNLTSTDVQSAIVELDSLVANITAGLDPKESVRAATVADIGATYSAVGGTAGTGSFTGAPATVDGVSLANSNRVLVKDQADPLQNGIYVVVSLGNWERAADQDGTPGSEVSGGNHTFVEQGTVNISTGWLVEGDGELTLNTDPIVWVRFGGNFVTLDHLTNANAHTAANITNVPAASGNFGTPTTTADVLATDTQGAVDELLDEKAQRTPAYTILGNLPTAASSEGMIAWVTSEAKLYVSDGTVWVPLVREDFSLPYDLNYFIGGNMTQASAISGSHIATRILNIDVNAPGSRAFANTVPLGNVSYDINVIPAGGGAPTTIGTVDFLAGLGDGTISIASVQNIAVGEQLQIVNPGVVDANIEDVVINIVACAAADPCEPATGPAAPTITVNGFVDEVNGPIFDFTDPGLFTFGGGAITSYTWRVTHYDDVNTFDAVPPTFLGAFQVTGTGTSAGDGLVFDDSGDENGPTTLNDDVSTYVGSDPLVDEVPIETNGGSGYWWRLELVVANAGGSDTGIVFFHPAGI